MVVLPRVGTFAFVAYYDSNGVPETYSPLGVLGSILIKRKPTTGTLCPTFLGSVRRDLFYAQLHRQGWS